MTEDTELPPLDAPPEEWDDKWSKSTTITVDRWLKALLDADRDGQPWNEYLESLHQQKNDPLTLSEVDAIAEELENALEISSMASEPGVDVSELYERLESIERRLDNVPEDTAEVFSRKFNR